MKIGKLVGYNEVTKNLDGGGLFTKTPFKLFYSTIDDSDYEDYNNIVSINTYWKSIGQYQQIRTVLAPIVISKASANYSTWGTGLTSDERSVAIKWILAPYQLRVPAISDSDDRDNFKELLEQTAGRTKESLVGRERIVEEMRQHIGLEQFRTDIITKADLDDYYDNVADLIQRFIGSNEPHFYYWLNGLDIYGGSPGTGYPSKSYFSQTALDELNKIYSGFY